MRDVNLRRKDALMLLNGKKLYIPNEEVIAIPRGDTSFIFKATPVVDYDDLEKLCPRPVPPVRLFAGGTKQQNVEDPTYLKAVDLWSQRRVQWMICKSLLATEGLKWESVSFDDPETWGNYDSELKAAGFSDFEINRIVDGVIAACGMSQSRVDEATKSFLAGQVQPLNLQFFQDSGLNATPSGEPVNVSDSHQKN